jgi:hypothetical protein
MRGNVALGLSADCSIDRNVVESQTARGADGGKLSKHLSTKFQFQNTDAFADFMQRDFQFRI